MNAVAASPIDPQRSQTEIEWAEIASAAPQLAETMRRYLRQAATFLAPASVDSADGALRIFARWLLANTTVIAVGEVTRDAIEDFKVYLAGRPGMRGASLSQNSQRQRLRTLRVFFERIIEWDWADTPPRNPILNWDLPKRPEPLPKFLDDAQAAKLMAAARASRDPRDRLIVELLARTGMRSGELTALDADAMVRIGQGHWLRIPIGKLRNDRYVPLHPQLVDLLTAWTATNVEHIRAHRRLVADHRGPLNRYIVERTVARVGRAAGVEGVHPHRLRHTLATQAINRGMTPRRRTTTSNGADHAMINNTGPDKPALDRITRITTVMPRPRRCHGHGP
jgi:site-specific recombinase XerD